MSIVSFFSFSLFCCTFVVAVDDDDDFSFWTVVVVVAVVSMLTVDVLFCCFSSYVFFWFCVFKGDFFLFPRTTWVDLSSLFGLFPVSVLGSSSVEMVIAVVVVVEVDDIGLVVV